MEHSYVTYDRSKKISINPSCHNNPFYRYMVAQLIISVNKGKTYFHNINIVAKELGTNPIFILKYFSIMLGTQGKYDTKGSQMTYLSGIFDAERISGLMIQFINNFILCNNCELPELNHEKVQEKVILTCRSCGHHENINKRDLPDLFVKYVKSYL